MAASSRSGRYPRGSRSEGREQALQLLQLGVVLVRQLESGVHPWTNYCDFSFGKY